MCCMLVAALSPASTGEGKGVKTRLSNTSPFAKLFDPRTTGVFKAFRSVSASTQS